MKPGGSWRIVAATEDWGGKTWDLEDDRGGRWGNFPNRITATACVAGFKAIGFVPRPEELAEPAGSRQPARPLSG